MYLSADLILFFLIILFVLWCFLKFNEKDDFYKNIPGPPALPILGNALEFRSFEDFLKTVDKLTKKYGDVFKMQIGPTRMMLVVSDYKFLEMILSSTVMITKSFSYDFMESWLGSGLLTSDGPKWKKHRKMVTPAFHFKILEQFVDVFESCGGKLLEKLEAEVGKKSVDVYPFITLCALDIICETAMGLSINAQDNQKSDYVLSVKEMGRIATERSFSAIENIDFLYRFTKNYQAERKAVKIIHDHTDKVILKRREELANRISEEHDEENTFSKAKKPFLDLILESTIDGQPLTNEEIREEVDTFMFAGHDTTSSAMSFALYCLANHPEVQEEALVEQRNLFPDQNDPTVTYRDLQNMKYLEHVIKETLRLYPSAPLYARRTTNKEKFDNKTLPEGDTVVIFAYGIHRNPKYFENPEEFNPSRFETIDGKLPYAYIPFSAGPRNCIGQKFAMLEMKSILSKILRKFELKPASPKHELNLVADNVLTSANGVKISLALRK